MASVTVRETAGAGLYSRKRIEEMSGEKISACFQCEKCSNGCPMVFAMDIQPHRVMHCLQLGLVEEVLNSDTIWVCVSCQTCTTRCPNDIDIAHVVDTLRQLSARRQVKESQKSVAVFHTAFLSSIKRFGRVHEASMVVSYAFQNEGITGVRKQLNLGLEMMRKGKIKLVPSRLWAGKQVKEIFRKAGRKRAQ
ncbi:MAG: 4Fe-4S dicluster domain-containing protein [Dehalococcoidia bacterium]|nr:4Fe-4S dicluster domain-containing protein [Dehalococcoidia bacterium]